MGSNRKKVSCKRKKSVDSHEKSMRQCIELDNNRNDRRKTN